MSSNTNTAQPDKSARARDWLAVAAILGAGIWRLTTWYYQYIVIPGHAPQHVNISTQVTPAGEENGTLALRVNISLTNRSSRTVYIPEAAMLLAGYKARPSGWSCNQYFERANLRLRDRQVPELTSSYDRKASSGNLLGYGIFATSWQLEPGESMSRSHMMYVDTSGCDFITLTVTVVEMGRKGKGGFFQLQYIPTFKGKKQLVLMPSQAGRDYSLPLGYQLTSSEAALSFWSLTDPSSLRSEKDASGKATQSADHLACSLVIRSSPKSLPPSGGSGG